MEQIKLHWNNIEDVNQMFKVLVDRFEDGAVFFATDREKVIYKHSSRKFDVPNITIGIVNKNGGAADTVLKNQQVTELHLERHVYGVRTAVVAGPLWSDDETEVLGVWALAVPKVHKMVGSFDYFAPIITELLPDGGVMYLNDRNKIVKSCGSSKYKNILIKDGTALQKEWIFSECLQSNRPMVKELPRERFGIVGKTCCYPLVDEESNETVGVFTMVLPREIQAQLKNMANNLGRGLSEVSAAMEEMAASSTEVTASQDKLHTEIQEVKNNANEINSVLAFIKEIADETKMLGLNAAIEAARAGDAGRGFGVVAEEIRKLSDQSKHTVIQIKELLDKVDSSIINTVKMSDSTLDVTQQIAAASEEVNASLEEMTSLAEQLDSTAIKL